MSTLTHCILVDSSTVTCWTSLFDILGMSGLFCHFYFIFFMEKPISKQCRPGQTPHCVASDLGLHCLAMNLLRFQGKNSLNLNSNINASC